MDKNTVDNASFVSHTATYDGSQFGFSSGWNYPGAGERQSLKLRIERTQAGETQVWHDEHPMVAVSFAELEALLALYFEVHVLAHDYQKLVEWDGGRGMVCLFV